MEHWNKKSQKDFMESITRESLSFYEMLLARELKAAEARLSAALNRVSIPCGHDHPEWV